MAGGLGGRGTAVTPPDVVRRIALLLLATAGLAAGTAEAGGPVVGWGDNYHGQATPPALVAASGAGTAIAIAVGGRHGCAIQAGSGAVVCWGDDSYGEATPPAIVNGSLGRATAIAAGDDFTLAIVPEPAGGALDWAALGILLALGHWRSPRGRVARRP
jgi:hypothetical protein